MEISIFVDLRWFLIVLCLPSKLQSIPQDIIDTHELQTITLDYRRECQYDDIVDSLTNIEGGEEKSMNGSASAAPHKEERQQFLHCLRFAANGDEINRGRTVWRKKLAR
jgi:fatty acyl-ACP thioesterase A